MNGEARARRIGDDAVALCREHDVRFHGGERCLPEAANLVAYVAHRVGLTLDASAEGHALFAMMVGRIGDFEAIYAEHHLEEEEPR